MSNPANAQNPYSPPAPAGAPSGYPQETVQKSAAVDRDVVRQIVFGGVVVVGIAAITSLLSTIGSWMYAFQPELVFSLFWTVFIAVVFVVGAGASALSIAPLAKATSGIDLLRKLAVAAAVGAAALLILNFIFSVVTGGQYLVQMIISSGILGSISSGISYGAFFALGVFIARALPARPQATVGQGYAVPQGYPQQVPVPQGYPQQAPAPQAPPAPQGYAQPQPPLAPQA
jgi:hypothetical protein